MRLFFILPLLAMFAIVAALLKARLRLSALRRLLAVIEADRIEDPPAMMPVLTVQALLSDTTVQQGSETISILPPTRRSAGDLAVSDWGLALRKDVGFLVRIPHTRILNALIVRVGAESPLRVDWERGGQRLSTLFTIEGGIRNAERVRKEIHLRAKRIPLPTVTP